jgi:hypothetical protein
LPRSIDYVVVEVIPLVVKWLLGGLAALAMLAGLAALLSAYRARRLTGQRARLLREVGILQEALLPDVPQQVGPLAVSTAYRPAEGLAAGGDFYDVFLCPDGRVGLVVGDVAGHGHDSLSTTTLVRYTLRAYLEGGLEPRLALKLADAVLSSALPEEQFVTAVAAVYMPATGALVYACAGHPPPVLVGAGAHEPVLAAASPPLGWGIDTGLRQTTVGFSAASRALFYTDGLVEQPLDGGLLGFGRLAERFSAEGRQPDARSMVDWVAAQGRRVRDDLAACTISPTGNPQRHTPRIEELEMGRREAITPRLQQFLTACGMVADKRDAIAAAARDALNASGTAVVRVSIADGRTEAAVEPGEIAAFRPGALRDSDEAFLG